MIWDAMRLRYVLSRLPRYHKKKNGKNKRNIMGGLSWKRLRRIFLLRYKVFLLGFVAETAELMQQYSRAFCFLLNSFFFRLCVGVECFTLGWFLIERIFSCLLGSGWVGEVSVLRSTRKKLYTLVKTGDSLTNLLKQ